MSTDCRFQELIHGKKMTFAHELLLENFILPQQPALDLFQKLSNRFLYVFSFAVRKIVACGYMEIR